MVSRTKAGFGVQEPELVSQLHIQKVPKTLSLSSGQAMERKERKEEKENKQKKKGKKKAKRKIERKKSERFPLESTLA